MNAPPIRSSRASSRRPPAVRIEPAPATLAAGAGIAWLVAAALGCLATPGLPAGVRIALSAAALFAGGTALRRDVLFRGPHALRSIEWLRDGRWRLEPVCGEAGEPWRLTVSARFGRVVFLRWRRGCDRRGCLLHTRSIGSPGAGELLRRLVLAAAR